MNRTFKTLIPVLCLALYGGEIQAQTPPAVPVTPVETEILSPQYTQTPVVLELFASQTCVFCPEANQLLADLIQDPNIIGLSCYVEFFTSSKEQMRSPFCEDRQLAYSHALHSGPRYTPQMIINGQVETIGYKIHDISRLIKPEATIPPALIRLDSVAEEELFDVTLPDINSLEKKVNLFLLFFDKPRVIMEKKGHSQTWHNMISRIEPLMPWNGKADQFGVKIRLEDDHAGIALFAQDQETGAILAAGQYKTP